MAEVTERRAGSIRCYGMFWFRDEIDWDPGRGRGGQFQLLGRLGANRPGLKLCDFRDQSGIYILHDDHGPTYVGLARDGGLGQRLKAHTADRLHDRWDRFSWFGFRRVLKRSRPDGLQDLGALPKKLLTDSSATIGDLEALLIQTLGTYRTGNRHSMKFASADKWTQIWDHDRDKYLTRVRGAPGPGR